MIVETTGDLLRAGAEALVNTVGIMGRGMALQFRNAFPKNFEAYGAACRRGAVEIGRMFVFETGSAGNPRLIINFPTKRHFRYPSRLEYVRAGLDDLASVLRARDVRSVAVPALGCGLGGTRWEAVKPLIVAALGALPEVRVLLYAPDAAGQR